MGLSLQEFFTKHCMVDYLTAGSDHDEYTYLLSPAIVGYEGQMAPIMPQGKCTLLQDNLCSIHAAKPYECKALQCGDHTRITSARHKGMRQPWLPQEHQDQLKELLGKPPLARELDPDVDISECITGMVSTIAAYLKIKEN